jgi:redox-sensitive bicupin YhaK (pirin superfamily)
MILYYKLIINIGGGNEIGELMEGFQIWINVPKENKMNDPEYGTVPNEDMPLISVGGNSNVNGIGIGKQCSGNGNGNGNGNTCSSDGSNGDGDVNHESTTISSQARILAGNVGNGFNTNNDDVHVDVHDVHDDNKNNYDSNVVGPFETKQKVQMIDFEILENDTVEFMIEDGLDTAMLYVYEGSLKTINGYNNQNQNDNNGSDDDDDDDDSNDFKTGAVVLLDADSSTKRKISLQAASASASTEGDNDNDDDDDDDGKTNQKNKNKKIGVMLFAGKKLKESIVWHGPIVMNTKEEIHKTFHDMKIGKFPPKRVDWNYKELKSKR